MDANEPTRPVYDPDRPCPHEDFAVMVEVNRLAATVGGPIEAYSADIRGPLLGLRRAVPLDRCPGRAPAGSALLQCRRDRAVCSAAPGQLGSGLRARHPRLRRPLARGWPVIQ